MGIIKDIKLYFSYKKILRKIRVDLEAKFNVRIDSADRMYTVVNIPPNLFEEPYNIRKGDIDAIAQSYMKDYIGSLSDFLNSSGLSEIYDFYEPIKKVEKYSYLVVLGYNRINSVDLNRLVYRRFLPIVGVIALIASLLYFLFR